MPREASVVVAIYTNTDSPPVVSQNEPRTRPVLFTDSRRAENMRMSPHAHVVAGLLATQTFNERFAAMSYIENDHGRTLIYFSFVQPPTRQICWH